MAMKVLRYKSAKYSIERPIHIGAALAGADADTVGALSRFGLPLGEGSPSATTCSACLATPM